MAAWHVLLLLAKLVLSGGDTYVVERCLPLLNDGEEDDGEGEGLPRSFLLFFPTANVMKLRMRLPR